MQHDGDHPAVARAGLRRQAQLFPQRRLQWQIGDDGRDGLNYAPTRAISGMRVAMGASR